MITVAYSVLPHKRAERVAGTHLEEHPIPLFQQLVDAS